MFTKIIDVNQLHNPGITLDLFMAEYTDAYIQTLKIISFKNPNELKTGVYINSITYNLIVIDENLNLWVTEEDEDERLIHILYDITKIPLKESIDIINL